VPPRLAPSSARPVCKTKAARKWLAVTGGDHGFYRRQPQRFGSPARFSRFLVFHMNYLKLVVESKCRSDVHAYIVGSFIRCASGRHETVKSSLSSIFRPARDKDTPSRELESNGSFETAGVINSLLPPQRSVVGVIPSETVLHSCAPSAIQ